MSQKGSNSRSPRSPRSKSPSCHDTLNQEEEEQATFDDLQNEIERKLQNSDKALSAASNFKGNSSKELCSASRSDAKFRGSTEREVDLIDETCDFDEIEGEDEQIFQECDDAGAEEEWLSRSHVSGPSGGSSMKKNSVRLSLPCGKTCNRNMHGSSKESRHENQNSDKFSLSGSSHHHHDHHHDHHHESRGELPEWDEKSKRSLSHLSQLKKDPSRFYCELDKDMDFLKVCNIKPKEVKRAGNRVSRLPEMPCLRRDEIEELIKCETTDVESAWHLFSDGKRTYKKPCPKQQKAQMKVKALVEASKGSTQSCGQKFPPLEHPEPEDISPEVAAAMMFLQEQGVKMEECPNDTITRLFPDDPQPPLPVKVDPDEKEQQEMIEKSASVPSEGVSDSAYTRTMKGKGEDLGPQRSYDVDFAIGQSKREYVFVTQKPRRVNIVQFRGGSAPIWFPWYLSAFPGDDNLKLASSPSGLFYKAWLHSNPENIQSNDVIVLE